MPSNAIMSNSSGLAIKDAFERLVKHQLPNQRWLGTKNYYKSDTVNRIDNESVPTLTRRKKQIEEYIAASVVVHCSDGWTYLSRSIESLINGDIASSIHFAYYAELRSAMSIMAFDGVGIFNRKHVWFDSLKAVGLSAGHIGTHKAVDIGMQEWAKQSSKKDDLFKVLRVNNRNLSDWIRETGFSSRSSYSLTVINRWLKNWSIDLHLKDDQILRNEMSYRPHFDMPNLNIQHTIDKILQIWNILEPTPADRFPILDKFLLRTCLEEIYKKVKGVQPIGPAFELFVRSIFNRLGEDTSQILFQFLLRTIEPNDHIIFEEAKKDLQNVSINRTDPFPIICRAILLLRLSTGAANRLISESSLSPANLRYWWENLCLQQGNISSISPGIDAIDLFTDIRDSIIEINSLPPGNFSSIKDAFDFAANPLFYLKQFHRAGIWGIGI